MKTQKKSVKDRLQGMAAELQSIVDSIDLSKDATADLTAISGFFKHVKLILDVFELNMHKGSIMVHYEPAVKPLPKGIAPLKKS